MQKLALTLVAVSALGLGACTLDGHNPEWQVPCGLERTACAEKAAPVVVETEVVYEAVAVPEKTVSKVVRK
ncbi:MAG: hypothetical protein JKP92_00425 [Alphaproteobacteria bacterium]|jgi:hypothetical protein|nr:hypothetical protein [Alphaproteobacteria bacterium]